MPKGGVLTVKTENINPDPTKTFSNADDAADTYVAMSVADVGHGMSEETIDRIFEPFFTTKLVGQGTGLGLSTVYGLVTKMHGHITVNSKLKAGTVFHVYLPKSEVTGDVQKAVHQVEQAATPTDRNETILGPDCVRRDLSGTPKQRLLGDHGRNAQQAMSLERTQANCSV